MEIFFAGFVAFIGIDIQLNTHCAFKIFIGFYFIQKQFIAESGNFLVIISLPKGQFCVFL